MNMDIFQDLGELSSFERSLLLRLRDSRLEADTLRMQLRRACKLLRRLRREVFTPRFTDRYGDGEAIDNFLREVEP